MNENETDLWRAVLMRGIADYLKINLRAAPDEHELIQQSAARWLYSNRDDIASFVWCCHIAGVEPGYVRRVVARARLTQASNRRAIFSRRVNRRDRGPDLAISF